MGMKPPLLTGKIIFEQDGVLTSKVFLLCVDLCKNYPLLTRKFVLFLSLHHVNIVVKLVQSRWHHSLVDK